MPKPSSPRVPVFSIRPGDELELSGGEYVEIERVQPQLDREGRPVGIYLISSEEAGEPRTIVNLNGDEVTVQPWRTFHFPADLQVPVRRFDEPVSVVTETLPVSEHVLKDVRREKHPADG